MNRIRDSSASSIRRDSSSKRHRASNRAAASAALSPISSFFSRTEYNIRREMDRTWAIETGITKSASILIIRTDRSLYLLVKTDVLLRLRLTDL